MHHQEVCGNHKGEYCTWCTRGKGCCAEGLWKAWKVDQQESQDQQSQVQGTSTGRNSSILQTRDEWEGLRIMVDENTGPETAICIAVQKANHILGCIKSRVARRSRKVFQPLYSTLMMLWILNCKGTVCFIQAPSSLTWTSVLRWNPSEIPMDQHPGQVLPPLSFTAVGHLCCAWKPAFLFSFHGCSDSPPQPSNHLFHLDDYHRFSAFSRFAALIAFHRRHLLHKQLLSCPLSELRAHKALLQTCCPGRNCEHLGVPVGMLRH